MNKIFLVIQREYLVRIKKKSFIIMTLLGPLLFGSLMVGPALVAMYAKDDSLKNIAVIDETGKFQSKLPEKDNIKFRYLQNTTLDQARKTFAKDSLYGILYIPTGAIEAPSGVRFFSKEKPNLELKNHLENAIGKEIEKGKLAAYNIADIDTILKKVKTDVSIRTIQWNEDGTEKESSAEMSMIIAYISGFAIYMFIFLFGAQVMRGVIEEKTSRIVEVIISSIKPFQLMMGKILGIAAVAVTQLLIWVLLTTGIFMGVKTFLIDKSASAEQIQNVMVKANSAPMAGDAADMSKASEVFSMIGNANLPFIICCFFFFFIGGYLLYSAMFAAIGAAVDNETETQQFMLPVTIPLILAILIMTSTFQDPNSSLSFWASMIPFTSPIIMMARVAYGVPDWQLALSGVILVASFVGMTWLSGKIYRVGILMYGKKTSWKEILKWMRYSN